MRFDPKGVDPQQILRFNFIRILCHTHIHTYIHTHKDRSIDIYSRRRTRLTLFRRIESPQFCQILLRRTHFLTVDSELTSNNNFALPLLCSHDLWCGLMTCTSSGDVLYGSVLGVRHVTKDAEHDKASQKTRQAVGGRGYQGVSGEIDKEIDS